MKKPLYIIIVFQFIYLFISCDPGGNLFLTNGYEYNVMVHSFYDFNATVVERFDEFYPGMTFAVAARHAKYKNITSIQIETLDGLVLASYTPEYLMLLRKAYIKKKNQLELWVFTEKGLFFETDEIGKRYKWDKEKVLAYYRSDEAVEDLQAMLKKEYPSLFTGE
jgi:hypothetical protein